LPATLKQVLVSLLIKFGLEFGYLIGELLDLFLVDIRLIP
jgi:hypothetical protein